MTFPFTFPWPLFRRRRHALTPRTGTSSTGPDSRATLAVGPLPQPQPATWEREPAPIRPQPGCCHVSLKRVYRGTVEYVGKLENVVNPWGMQVPSASPRNHMLTILEWQEPTTGQLYARVLASDGEPGSFGSYDVSPRPDHPEIPC